MVQSDQLCASRRRKRGNWRPSQNQTQAKPQDHAKPTSIFPGAQRRLLGYSDAHGGLSQHIPEAEAEALVLRELITCGRAGTHAYYKGQLSALTCSTEN
jgi:hypothetical protein